MQVTALGIDPWPLNEREGAELLIDDKPRRLGDRRRIELKLTPGKHRIRVRRKGYRDKARTVQLKVGETKKIEWDWIKER